MKVLSISLACILFFGCSDNRNNLMTSLVNQKKVVEDSIQIAHGYEMTYEEKAKESHDSTIWKPMVDTQMIYFAAGIRLKKRLEEIEFSVDSLSKMK
jgi:hypothetical protein